MSILAISWALKAHTGSPSAKLVLVKLADNANDEGKCWPSIRHISDHTELSERAIRDQIRKLEKLGLISTVRRSSEGVQLPNIYQLHLRETVGVGHHMQGGGAGVAPGVGQGLPPNLQSKPSKKPSTTSGFVSFFEAMPRKQGKKAAEAAYSRAIETTTPEVLLAAAKLYARKALGFEERYILTPVRWLQDERWTDYEVCTVSRQSAFNSPEELEGQRKMREKYGIAS